MSSPVIGRIRERSTFRALRRPVGRASRGPLRVSFYPGAHGALNLPSVGFAISRQCGSSVTRNRLRRQMRAVARQSAPQLPAGAYLIRTDPAAAALTFAELAPLLKASLMAASQPRTEV